MTENEAIKHLQSYAEVVDNMIKYCKDFEPKADITGYLEKKTVFAMAISALKEVQQYREIGTVEECREAVETQKAKKPVCKPTPYNESVGFNEEWFCPSCGAYIGYFYEGMDEPEQMEYCNECGQHIARDWSDENEDE